MMASSTYDEHYAAIARIKDLDPYASLIIDAVLLIRTGESVADIQAYSEAALRSCVEASMFVHQNDLESYIYLITVVTDLEIAQIKRSYAEAKILNRKLLH
jgi:hypothetical protein